MTFSQIVSFICSKVGQSDAASLALCKGFVNTRYRMIYDAAFWTDARTVSSFVYSGVSTALPAQVERIMSARTGATYLDAIDETFLMETQLPALDTPGVPRFYHEFRGEDGTNRVALYPPPIQAQITLQVVGKRTLILLNGDTEVPVLRNIDNALIAFAMGDLLERQRQYAKAQAKFQEAGAHLEMMKTLEAQQTAAPRRARPVSAAGDTLGEMADDVQAKAGDYSPASRIVVLGFLRRSWQTVADSFPWRDLRTNAGMGTVAGTSVYDYPAGVARITSIVAASALQAVTAEYLADADPEAVAGSGTPRYFTTADNVRKFAVYPKPNAQGVMTVYGRRETPTLTLETDRPAVRGLGNSLVLMALADFLMAAKDQRAPAVKEEAMGLVKQAQDAEAADSFHQRQSARVTTAGDSLGSMAEEVAGRLNDYAPDTLVVARQCLRRALRSLWDERLWRDAIRIDPLTTATGVVSLSAGAERVISVVSNGLALDPVSAEFISETRPDILTGTGTPIYYRESSGPSLILYPAPATPAALLVTVKTAAPTMGADTDPPVLRGAAPVLIEMALGMMLLRRGEATAAAVMQQAQTLAGNLVRVEDEQTFHSRRARPLSVNGSALGDMADEVAARLGDYAPATLILIKSALRREWQTLWDGHLWTESLAVARASVPAGGCTVALPDDLERAVAVRLGGWGRVAPSELGTQFGVGQAEFASGLGTPATFAPCVDAYGTPALRFASPVAAGACVCVLGKRRFTALDDDADCPLLPNAAPVLVDLAHATLVMTKDPATGNAMRMEAERRARVLVDLQTNQGANVVRMIPDDAGYGYAGQEDAWNW